MTDAEIIKALECCKNDDCDNCPNNFGNCYANLAGYALDLISRQKAEIEKLTYQVNRLKKYDEERDIRLHTRLIATAKAEAINKFVERLIELYTDEHITDDMHCSIGVIKQNIYDMKEIMGCNK